MGLPRAARGCPTLRWPRDRPERNASDAATSPGQSRPGRGSRSSSDCRTATVPRFPDPSDAGHRGRATVRLLPLRLGWGTANPRPPRCPRGRYPFFLEYLALHQFHDLVGQEVAIHHRHLEDPHVVAPADVLEKRIAGLLVERQEQGLVRVQGVFHRLYEVRRFDLHLTDLVDHDHIGVRRRGLKRVHADLFERADVHAVPADHRLRLDLAGGEDPLLLGSPVHHVEAFPPIPLHDRLRDHAADLEAVALKHLDDLQKTVRLAGTGEARNADFERLTHATHAAP